MRKFIVGPPKLLDVDCDFPTIRCISVGSQIRLVIRRFMIGPSITSKCEDIHHFGAESRFPLGFIKTGADILRNLSEVHVCFDRFIFDVIHKIS